MNFLKALAAIAMLSLLTACSSIPVTQDYLPGTDFSTLKTYHWDSAALKSENNLNGHPLLNSRIHSAIDHKLASMGYVLKNDNNTDFTVSFQTVMRQRLTSDGPTTSFAFGFGSFGNFGGIGIGTGTTLRDQDEITLVINILNGKDSKLLWRGTSTRYAYPYDSPQELTDVVNKHVDAILSQFPPGTKTEK